ncbi:glutathione peroxidase 3-like [Ambystoma mexicanum]|uniref:glutathione peroxidase 3-like n=1 Tax=Ambystoma mexicanum TaxID=8296 RepID=UPI0037E92C0B
MRTLKDAPFTVLGFPCNQFGLQTPEENKETLNVLKYVRPGQGFSPDFPIFAKVEVNGLKEHPLYTFLKESCSFVNPTIGDTDRLHWSPLKVSDVRWNFEKFLVDAEGIPQKRYDLKTSFEVIEKDICMLLNKNTLTKC